MKKLLILLLIVMFAAPVAHAIPVLQLYIEGATYDYGSESWVWGGEIGVDPVRLWVIGNVSGPGSHGAVRDVRLSASFVNTGFNPTITLAGTQVGGSGSYMGVDDPSTAGPATLTSNSYVTDGSSPTLSDGSSLAPHGEYGANRAWKEWDLGDFWRQDSHIGDWIGDFPLPADLNAFAGQINAYDLTISASDFAAVGSYIHFDAYNHIEGENHARFAPFSHDASIPEPGTLALLGLGLAGAGLRFRRRK